MPVGRQPRKPKATSKTNANTGTPKAVAGEANHGDEQENVSVATFDMPTFTSPTFGEYNNNQDNTNNAESEPAQKIPKKRGRKPKGGKIIEQSDKVSNGDTDTMPNVIIHFKCSLDDIKQGVFGSSFKTINEVTLDEYNKRQTDEVLPNESNQNVFHGTKTNDFNMSLMTEYNDIEQTITTQIYPLNGNQNSLNLHIGGCNSKEESYCCSTIEHNVDESKAQGSNADANWYIWQKLKELEVKLHNNSLNGKRSACFWDTCQFDTPMFYIPKFISGDSIKCYGCFCSIPCALAYLDREDIDSSTKYERKQLLYHVYREVFDNRGTIYPAPDPRYTLDKFLGNLTIQEWRSLLKSDRLLLIVDKPLTPELPELHIDHSEQYVGKNALGNDQYGKYKIRKVPPKQSKGEIVAEKFGITTRR